MILAGGPAKVSITKIIATHTRIEIFWKQLKQHHGITCYVELRYKCYPLEEWYIKLIPPEESFFVAFGLPPAMSVMFELRAVCDNDYFGPVTKKTVKTKGMIISDVFICICMWMKSNEICVILCVCAFILICICLFPICLYNVYLD